MDNYAKIASDNLKRLYGNLPGDLENRLAGEKNGLAYLFKAFGQPCVIAPDGIAMDGLADVGETTSKKILELVG